MLESALEDYLTDACKENGVMVVKQTGMRGIPDRLLIKDGMHAFLELKKPGEKPRPLQVEIAKKLRRHGALSLYADGRTGIDDIIKAMCMKDKLESFERLMDLQHGMILKFEKNGKAGKG